GGGGQGALAVGASPPHLVGAGLRVPDRRQRHGDEPPRIRRAPFIDVPVVVGLHQRPREIGVLGGEQPRRESGERREVHRRQNPAGVLVLAPLVPVIPPRPALFQPL